MHQKSAHRFTRRRSLNYSLVALLLVAVAAGLISSPRKARAAALFTVNDTGDTHDVNAGDGICADSSGRCTLRAAIEEANNLPGDDVINFSVTGKITLNDDLRINQGLTIVGPGANQLTVQRSSADGTPRFRIFVVTVGVTANIAGLTMTGGYTVDADRFCSSCNGEFGGGIFNRGTLTLSSVAVVGNRTGDGGLAAPGSGDSAGSGGDGGGIYNEGTLRLLNSTVSGNQTGIGHDNGGSGGNGGGIANSGTLTIINSTISGNRTGDGTSLDLFRGSSGGGISSQGNVIIWNSTISNNTAGNPNGRGGGVQTGNGSVIVTSTIIAGNSSNGRPGADVSGSIHSQGYDLIQTPPDAPIIEDQNAGTNIIGVDPQLGPLQDNGGPTQTQALSPNSPAIDKGRSFGAITDQRGLARLDSAFKPNALGGDGADIGAFELQNQPPTASCEAITVIAASSCAAIIGVNDINNGSFDPEGDVITLSFNPSSLVTSTTLSGPGDHTVTLYVTDNHGAQSSCSSTVHVVDITPPVVNPPAAMTVSADANCQAAVPNVVPQTTASDVCGSVTLQQIPAAGTLVGLGPHSIVVTATDAAGNSSEATTTFTVKDTTPPIITGASASPSTLSATNKMVDVNVGYTVSDNCSSVNSTLSISCNEATNPGDMVVVDDHHVRLMASRLTNASARVYTITITATDQSGNSSQSTTTVNVPSKK